MFSFVDDLTLLKYLGVVTRPPKAPKIIPVNWHLPPSGWLKVNIDVVASSASSLAADGGVFRTSHEFLGGCFAIFLGSVTAFEEEICAALYAIEAAQRFLGIKFGLKVIQVMLRIISPRSNSLLLEI